MKTNLLPKGRKEWVIALVGIFVFSIPISILIKTYSIQINHRLVGSFPAMFVDKCSKKCLDSLPEELSVLSDEYIQAFYIQSTESHVAPSVVLFEKYLFSSIIFGADIF